MKALIALALLLAACGTSGEGWDTDPQLSNSGFEDVVARTVMVQGTPLKCIVMSTDTAAGLSCDWQSWHELRAE